MGGWEAIFENIYFSINLHINIDLIKFSTYGLKDSKRTCIHQS